MRSGYKLNDFLWVHINNKLYQDIGTAWQLTYLSSSSFNREKWF